MALFFKSRFLKEVDSVIKLVLTTKSDFDKASAGVKIHQLEMELEEKIIELKKLLDNMKSALPNMNIAKKRLDKVSEKLRLRNGDLDAIAKDRQFAVDLFEKYHSEYEIAKKQVDRFESKYGSLNDLLKAKAKVSEVIHNL